MRILRSVVLPCSLLALAAASACTQPPSGEGSLIGAPERGPDTGDTSETLPAPDDQTPKSSGSSGPVNDTCIGKAGFTFDDGGQCDVCMSDQDGCCQKLVACFKDDPECAALQKCVDDCSGSGGGGGGGAGTDAGNDGGDDGGALTGKACKDACKSTYAGSLTKWNDYQVCITTTCKTQCP
jgi:hypothetical protein